MFLPATIRFLFLRSFLPFRINYMHNEHFAHVVFICSRLHALSICDEQIITVSIKWKRKQNLTYSIHRLLFPIVMGLLLLFVMFIQYIQCVASVTPKLTPIYTIYALTACLNPINIDSLQSKR